MQINTFKIFIKTYEGAVGAVAAGAGAIGQRAPQIADIVGEQMGEAVAKMDPVTTGVVVGDKTYDTAANFINSFLHGMGENRTQGLFNVAATCAVVTGRVLYRTATAVTGSIARAWTWFTNKG